MTVTLPARLVRASLLGLAVLAVAAGPAVAHADFVSSDPADGAVVESPFDGPVVLTYDEALFPGSSAELIGPGGSTLASAEIEADKLVFTLDAALDPGEHTIQWVSVSADRDILRGTLTFMVAAPPPTPTAGASASPSSSPAPSASPTPSGNGTPSGTTGDVLLPLIAVVIAVGAIGAFLLRNRRIAGR